jgi:hypothetical protein
MNNNNRMLTILDVVTIVVLALLLIAMLSRLFLARPTPGPAGPGGGARINPPAQHVQVISHSVQPLALVPVVVSYAQ